MTRDEAVAIIQEKLSFRTGNASSIIARMQEAQRNREKGRTLPWFLLSEDQTLSGTADVASVSLPSDFLRESEDEVPRYVDSDGDYVRELEKGSFNQLTEVWKDSDQTTPFAYALRKSTIYVFPTPTAAWTLKWSYYAKADVLTSDIENDWLEHAPDIIIADAGLLMAADLHDNEAVQKFTATLIRAEQALMGEIVEREIGGRTLLMGGNR